jgi:DNA-binding winged helix-turn-helix (wHTH) protein/tetratricopeptide (TPR) repeat protein
VRFESFEFDPEAGELRRNGSRVRVQDKTLRLLALLVERPGALVTRADLRRRLWPDEFVDFDNSLNNAVARLRAALGDAAESPRFVETVGRRGYRFVAATTSANAHTASEAVSSTGRTRLQTTPMRLAVLPFRLLRTDASIEFLTRSLPDAVCAALAGLESLAVRSPLAAARFDGDAPDLAAVAGALDVNLVLSGTILHVTDRLRLRTQLVEAPSGTLLWSHTQDAALQSIFELQDQLTTHIVESLALPLSATEYRLLHHDVPAAGPAYALYLRANDAGEDPQTVEAARDLYLESIRQDPDYAPAWARLGRLYRLMAKYGAGDSRECLGLAEEAFRHALAINPELSIAHRLYAQLEFETRRIPDALARLLGRVREHPADANLYAALVSGCRYGGLLEASLAAHARARRLDPNVRTGVTHTYRALADYDAAIREAERENDPALPLNLWAAGRVDEALALTIERQPRYAGHPFFFTFMQGARLCFEGATNEGLDTLRTVFDRPFSDAEAWVYMADILAAYGDSAGALHVLAQAVDVGGFACPVWLERDRYLEACRRDSRFQRLIDSSVQHHEAALNAFREAAGDEILSAA